MPYLVLRTNQPLIGDRKNLLLSALSGSVAEILGKPERYVMVSLEDDRPMLFAGTFAPMAYLELKSIDLPGSRAGELSTALCQMLEAQLGIPPERVYIEFTDVPRKMWGWNGGTF